VAELTPSLDDCLIRSERIVGRKLAGEYVLVPIVDRSADADAIYSLSAVAAFLWERLDGRTAGHALVDQVVAAFHVERDEASRDYLEFVTQLTSIGAVRPA
jgi:hypothetical protein